MTGQKASMGEKQDWNLTDQIAGWKNAGLENDGIKYIHYLRCSVSTYRCQ